MSTVTITCACGKMLRARAADAGKKCKCVGCGKILVIPMEVAGVAKPPVDKAESQVVRAKTHAAGLNSVTPPPRVGSRPPIVSKPVPKPVSKDDSLDPIPLNDLLSDLAIGPVEAPQPFELPELNDPVPSPVGRRSKPLAMSKSELQAAPDVVETLAARSALRPRQRPEATGRGGSFHINWKYPALAIVIFLIVGLVLFIKLGPAKAAAEWTKAQEEGDNVVESVVGKALKSYLATNGGWTPGDSHYQPSVKTVAWLDLPVMIVMPDKVGMHGETTHGKFQGFYFTRTGETEADVDVYGTRLRVTGRIDKDGKVVAEINGKVVEIPDIVQRDRQDYK